MSQPVPIEYSAAALDLSTRLAGSSTVVASPALAAETIIAQVTIPNNIQVLAGVRLEGWCAFTMGTSGDHYTLRIRETNVSGTVVSSTGTIAASAGALVSPVVYGFDTTAGPILTYCLTLQVANGAAASTVSAVRLNATPI